MDDFVFNPWQVKGNIDYDKIINEFGVKKIDDVILKRLKKYCKNENIHYFLKRKIFFVQRDLEFVLDQYDKKNKFFLYTGRSPSGNTHLGHLIPWIFTKWLADIFDVDLFFQFPDDEKFLFKENISLEDTKKYTYENMLDVIALGFDSKKTHFIVNTIHANLLYKQALKVAKKITYSTVKSSFGFTNQTNIGSIFYTSMQTVPVFLPSVLKNKNIPCLIPHAIDQDPHFRVTRDVVYKLGYFKPSSIQCRFLPGLSGMSSNGKMSSSGDKNQTIFTTDDELMVKNKINKYAFSGGKETIKDHRKYGGDPDIDTSYQWLTFFEKSDKKLEKIYQEYKEGILLSGELKAILIEKLNLFLKNHQEKRKKAKDKIDDYLFNENNF